MKNFNFKKFIIAVLIAATVCTSVLAVLFGMNKTYSSYVSVIVPEGNEVCVYVSGNDVKKSVDGYMVTPNSKITVTVINESKLFTGMTINGKSYFSAVAELTVPESGKVTVEVQTEEPYAEDMGKYFGNPYVLSKEADVLAVARILRTGTASAEDLEQISAPLGTTAEDIRYGYYRLGTNLFISDSEFFGLGFRGGLPFGGCFDFDGYTATINMVRTEHLNEEFSFVDGTHYADYGFFAYACGDGVRPCLIRNVKMQGFIGINTVRNQVAIDHTDHVNAGGVAGVAGKNIIFDDIESTVSVSAQSRFANLYIGGVFGVCSSSVESWCDVVYDGAFNEVSGVTYGENAGAIVGGFAGVLHNAGVNGVTIDGERSMVLANALGSVSGSAIAGGFVGVIELGAHTTAEISEPRPIIIKNVTIYAESDYSVNAVIDNDGATNKSQIDPDDFNVNSAAAVSGGIVGIVGIVNRGRKNGAPLSEDCVITFSDIYFMRTSQTVGKGDDAAASANNGRLEIKASTEDGDSSGAVFAGGTVGYIYGHGGEYIVRDIPQEVDVKYFFDCHVDISAVQNGTGPAYAGGAFGYNAFRIETTAEKTLKFGIVSPEYDYTVTAMQSASSGSAGKKYYNVCAGGYTSRFNIGYSFNHAEFYLGNGKITAYREVGSTAIGDVNAGGVAGRILGYGSAATTINDYNSGGSQSGTSDGVTVYYTSGSRVEASCYSYSSVNGTGTLGNNVCAGGAIGYVLGYSQISGFSVIFDENAALSGKSAEHFVYGAQNAKNPLKSNGESDDDDLKTEGFVGGIFGLVIDTKLSDIKLVGDKSENSVVYFTSSSSPNTASVGGLIGAIWRRKLAANTVILSGASVENVHSAGKAYCELTGNYDNYDIYVGGAIGVFANPSRASVSVTDITVNNCDIDAVGENTMLTYAGGIIAGMWWEGPTNLSYGIVLNSAVTASSITPCAYAGGIVGLMQYSNISYCLAKDTDVRAVSEQNIAYAAGITARSKSSDTIKNSYSNASLNSQGSNANNSVKYGIVAVTNSISSTGDMGTTSGAAKNLFVYETSGTASAYPKDSDTRALYLSSGYNNSASVEVGDSANVYSAVSSAQTSIEIKSHNGKVASVSGLTVKGESVGIAYLSAYCTIKNVRYLLCSYPVTVGGASENGSGLALKTDDGNSVSADTCDEYIEYTYGSGTSSVKYLYFRRNIGNPDTVKKVNALPVGAEYLPYNLKFYDIDTSKIGVAQYFTADSTATEKENRITDIIAAKKSLSACDVSAFNGRVNVGYNYVNGNDEGDAKKSVYFYANDNVRENTVILMECDFGSAVYGVIIEFVPNKLSSIEIAPESGTPPLAVRVENGVTHYVYTAGDVVRFGATLHYRYPAPRSYVVETIYSGTGVTANGTVAVAAGGVYNVTCEDLRRNAKTTVVVEAKEEVDFSFAYSGATGSSDRKMVESCAFGFKINPQPGYGLDPTVSVTVNGVTATGTFSADGVTFTFGERSFVFPVVPDKLISYAYGITAVADFVDYAAENGGSVAFSAEYKKIYSLVFIANYNGNEFFTTTVAAGEKFSAVNPDGFDEWTKKLISARYGYDFRGFYTVSKAGDVSAYGKSFEDMQKDSSSEVSGTMRFYARWTYNITVDAPENVKVVSSMPHSMLEGGELIPLDANVGFGFVITTGDGWCGKPRYSAFIRTQDGNYRDITSLFSIANQENGYYVSSEDLESGYIYLKIYADNLEFAVGDDPVYDGSSLYTDGIFTVTYNVNYGAEDSLADFDFDFGSLSLPKGASMRLYYRKNGEAVRAGAKTLAAAESVTKINSFTSASGGALFDESVRTSAVTEKFELVVTLPNNTNAFNLTAAAQYSVKVNNYVYNSVIVNYGSYERATDAPDVSGGFNVEEFSLLPAVIKCVTYENGAFSFYDEGKADETVTDHRHNGVYYMWRIEKSGGGYIGSAAFDSFGKEAVRTTDAIYYLAAKGSVEVAESLSGYTVSLIEVKNVQQPAEGLIIYSRAF